jgi:hypothetical protein
VLGAGGATWCSNSKASRLECSPTESGNDSIARSHTMKNLTSSTRPKTLRLATAKGTGSFHLPLSAVLDTLAIMAVKGAGKTYAFLVLAEEFYRLRLPFVILDPVGVCWGLRASASGERDGLPVVVIGGKHGDLPLHATSGKIVAEFVAQRRGSVVIDFSNFDTKADQIRFTLDFLTTLYRINRQPLAIVLDEADDIAPQKPFGEEARMLRAAEVLVRRGRARGLYPIFATQRAAVLNKNVLTQCGALLVGRTTSPQDRKAVEDWIKGYTSDDQRREFMDMLTTLDNGEFYVWAPRERVFERIKIRKRTTFDSSATPEHGGHVRAPKRLAAVDLKKLSAEMQRVAEDAKQNDTATLKARVRELERALSAKSATVHEHKVALAETVREKIKTVKVPALTKKQQRALGRTVSAFSFMKQHAERIERYCRSFEQPLRELVKLSVALQQPQIPPAPVRPVPTPSKPAPPPKPRPVPQAGDGGRLYGGEINILRTIVAHNGRDIPQLVITSGGKVKRASVVEYVRRLMRKGLVYLNGDTYLPTTAGEDAAGDVERVPTNPADLVAHWRSRFNEGSGIRQVFDYVMENGDGVPVDELAHTLANERLSVGSIREYLRRLTRQGVIVDEHGRYAPHPSLGLKGTAA